MSFAMEFRAAEEGATIGDDDDSKADKDNRKLPKAERMRKVMKHKETGTELFKGKNYVHATKHYRGEFAVLYALV